MEAAASSAGRNAASRNPAIVTSTAAPKMGQRGQQPRFAVAAPAPAQDSEAEVVRSWLTRTVTVSWHSWSAAIWHVAPSAESARRPTAD